MFFFQVQSSGQVVTEKDLFLIFPQFQSEVQHYPLSVPEGREAETGGQTQRRETACGSADLRDDEYLEAHIV